MDHSIKKHLWKNERISVFKISEKGYPIKYSLRQNNPNLRERLIPLHDVYSFVIASMPVCADKILIELLVS